MFIIYNLKSAKIDLFPSGAEVTALLAMSGNHSQLATLDLKLTPTGLHKS